MIWLCLFTFASPVIPAEYIEGPLSWSCTYKNVIPFSLKMENEQQTTIEQDWEFNDRKDGKLEAAAEENLSTGIKKTATVTLEDKSTKTFNFLVINGDYGIEMYIKTKLYDQDIWTSMHRLLLGENDKNMEEFSLDTFKLIRCNRYLDKPVEKKKTGLFKSCFKGSSTKE